jgi:hypothetical protein
MQAKEEKRMAVGVKELEEKHQHFDALILKAQSAVLHPLHNSAVHEGSAYDYKQPGATTPDGSKHKSLPPLSEDTSYTLPLKRTSSIGRLGDRSFKGSTSALNSDSEAISKSRTTITQEAPTPGLATLPASILLMIVHNGNCVMCESISLVLPNHKCHK